MLKQINAADGVIVAPDLEKEELREKISAIKYVRENNIPFWNMSWHAMCMH